MNGLQLGLTLAALLVVAIIAGMGCRRLHLAGYYRLMAPVDPAYLEEYRQHRFCGWSLLSIAVAGLLILAAVTL